MLQSTGSQRVRHDLATEQQQLFVDEKFNHLSMSISHTLLNDEFKVILRIIPARFFIDPGKLVLRSTEWRTGQIILRT